MVLRPLEMLKLTLAILSPTLLLPFLPTLVILKGRPPRMPPSFLASNVLRITNEPTAAAFAYPNFVQPGGQRSVHSDFPFYQSLRSLGHSCTRQSFDPVFNFKLELFRMCHTLATAPPSFKFTTSGA